MKNHNQPSGENFDNISRVQKIVEDSGVPAENLESGSRVEKLVDATVLPDSDGSRNFGSLRSNKLALYNALVENVGIDFFEESENTLPAKLKEINSDQLTEILNSLNEISKIVAAQLKNLKTDEFPDSEQQSVLESLNAEQDRVTSFIHILSEQTGRFKELESRPSRKYLVALEHEKESLFTEFQEYLGFDILTTADEIIFQRLHSLNREEKETVIKYMRSILRIIEKQETKLQDLIQNEMDLSHKRDIVYAKRSLLKESSRIDHFYNVWYTWKLR